jgi:hypothetical protein
MYFSFSAVEQGTEGKHFYASNVEVLASNLGAEIEYREDVCGFPQSLLQNS